MLASFQMALVGGQRAITPLAAVAIAAARSESPSAKAVPNILSNPVVASGALMLAIAEMAGDKQKTAPDRIVPVGLAARFVTSALAGAALAPRRRRWPIAIASGAIAVAASYPGWALRITSMRRYGQSLTGFIEDAAIIASAIAIMRNQAKS